MKKLIRYLRRHIKIVIMTLLFTGIFAVVFSLYSLPLDAVLYAALLCLVAGIILFIIGYTRHLRRLRELESLERRVTVSLDGLPAPQGDTEREYQKLLTGLFSALSEIEAKNRAERSETIDYYTLWAHQIKTPIAAMRLLLQSEGSENQAVSAELFRIEQYVEMVLSYLRLDSESSDLLLREYPLDDIVRQAIRKYACLFILKKQTLDFRACRMTVLTDEKWLLFVIEQLLSNALKYTPEGGRITVYAEGYRLFIEDNGIGICREDLPRVFEKGFTGYNGREDKKSTGIGLYLCRRVCRKLGHTVAVESDAGQGTRVIIDLTPGERVIE